MQLMLTDYLGLQRGDRLLARLNKDQWSDEAESAFDLLTGTAGKAGMEIHREWVDGDTAFAPPPASYRALLYVTRTYSHHRVDLRNWLGSLPIPERPRVCRLFDFSPELFELGVVMPMQAQRSLNESVMAAVNEASTMRVRGPTGTDLQLDLAHSRSWTSSFGASPGAFVSVLPAGEINTFCRSINGRLVATGSVNSNFGWMGDARLAPGELTIDISDGEIVDVRTGNPALAFTIRSFLEVENARRVGELGLGTNMGVSRYVSFVSHINERSPGLHLGFGTPTHSDSGVTWSCPVHLDVMLGDSDIWLDDTLFFHDGKYLLPSAPAQTMPSRVASLVDTQ